MTAGGVYRGVVLGDMALFGVLALPGAGSLVVAWLLSLSRALGLPGDLLLSPGALLFVHLVGAIGFGFAYLRLAVGATRQGIRATIAVKAFAAMLFVLAVAQGAPALFLAFGGADALQATLLLIAVSRGVTPAPVANDSAL